MSVWCCNNDVKFDVNCNLVSTAIYLFKFKTIVYIVLWLSLIHVIILFAMQCTEIYRFYQIFYMEFVWVHYNEHSPMNSDQTKDRVGESK